MKATFTFLMLALLSVGVAAQYSLPVTFETAEEDTCWAMFANDNGTMEMADNPDNGTINTSAKCMKMVVAADASPWAGAYSDYYGDVEITADNYMMQFMIYKDVYTNCTLKLEGNGQIEVGVENTETNTWELITFDFTEVIGTTFPRLVWFPDFPSTRTAGSTCYIDNIGFVGAEAVRKYNNELLSIYPNPTTDYLIVHYPGMTALTVSNVIGQQVMSMNFESTSQKQLDVNELKNGVYFITIDTAEGKFSTKFVKK